jgi:hypothetical protein
MRQLRLSRALVPASGGSTDGPGAQWSPALGQGAADGRRLSIVRLSIRLIWSCCSDAPATTRIAAMSVAYTSDGRCPAAASASRKERTIASSLASHLACTRSVRRDNRAKRVDHALLGCSSRRASCSLIRGSHDDGGCALVQLVRNRERIEQLEVAAELDPVVRTQLGPPVLFVPVRMRRLPMPDTGTQLRHGRRDAT